LGLPERDWVFLAGVAIDMLIRSCIELIHVLLKIKR